MLQLTLPTPPACAREATPIQVLSQGENTNGSQQQTQTVETSSKEPEGARKRKGKSKKRQQEPVIVRRPQAQAQQQQQAGSSTSTSGFAEWREGELLPRGWDKMNPVQKATELYAGKRGALFWANKVAWASLFIIGGAWILFRIVGPVTGLYTLKNDLLSPPNL